MKVSFKWTTLGMESVYVCVCVCERERERERVREREREREMGERVSELLDYLGIIGHIFKEQVLM